MSRAGSGASLVSAVDGCGAAEVGESASVTPGSGLILVVRGRFRYVLRRFRPAIHLVFDQSVYAGPQ
ncbi:hypothetical protein [Microbulbifer agarilyticus]|uniref:hypothetical protein n=1 Tax=Microbulbifer agarilyticus TaxID=260552 RepID=UPI001CD382AD|nr:hypothetical protein [Microbulbifer agarilyticus]MCA0901852.1 hypothetical protein [Microbulbifer agarilyticus]